MKKDLLKIINHYGIESQKRKFSEEAEELRDAIVEYEISNGYVGGAKNKRLKAHITEEIADVMVMLEQFRLYYDIPGEEIKEIIKYKIDRQTKRMSEEMIKETIEKNKRLMDLVMVYKKCSKPERCKWKYIQKM